MIVWFCDLIRCVLLRRLMKTRSGSKNSGLAAASREAVNKVLDRRSAHGTRGKKKRDDSEQNCDSIKRDKGKIEKGKQVAGAQFIDSVLEDKECGKSEGSDDEMNDSDWEDCPIPSLDYTVDANVDETRELTIEFDDVPDTKRQKNVYRATAEDKEHAELVHKVHLLCLLARGRIVDKACDDPLIQASLLSLLPSYLLKVSNLEKVTVKDIAPLLRWVRGNFSVRCTPSSEKSFRSSLAFALESREGTAEELAALAVSLLRALKLTTRFVSILDVASLKPGADKDESSGQNRTKMKHGIFSSSTLMVSKQLVISSSPNKFSSHVKNKSVCETSEPQHGIPLSPDQLQNTTVTSSCEAGVSSKSDGTRKKGDVEFEMQLAMALTATAAAENQHTDNFNEKNEIRDATSSLTTTKKIGGSPLSDQVISTAIGSKRVESPHCWAEVYCSGENMDGKWVHWDAVNGIIDAEQNVEAAAAACKTLLRYVVAFAGRGAKDVTRRYCTKWHKIASKRVSSLWWDMALAPLRQLESAATEGSANPGKEQDNSPNKHNEVNLPRNSSGLISAANNASSSSSSIGIRSALEDMELATRALTEPLPTNQQAYKTHELYALEKWFHKNQILHPKGPILGFCSGHPVYPRTCVQTLRTKERWLRDGLQLKANEVPLKILKRNLKLKKVKDLGDGDKNSEGSSQSMELYGRWQMEPLCLPHAVNGIVPKNERGQVDVWSEKCLPPGTVHIRLPRIFMVAKRLGIDYAPAMVGFEYRSGRATPLFEGIVVCTEFKAAILEAFAEEQERRDAEERRRKEGEAASRWYQLLLSIVTRERLKNRYANVNNDSVHVEPTSLEVKSETVAKPEKLKSPEKQRRGAKRGRSRGASSGSNSRRRVSSSSGNEYGHDHGHGHGHGHEDEDEHVHVFLDEQETIDEETSMKRRRCKCGFSVEVEQM